MCKWFSVIVVSLFQFFFKFVFFSLILFVTVICYVENMEHTIHDRFIAKCLSLQVSNENSRTYLNVTWKNKNTRDWNDDYKFHFVLGKLG